MIQVNGNSAGECSLWADPEYTKKSNNCALGFFSLFSTDRQIERILQWRKCYLLVSKGMNKQMHCKDMIGSSIALNTLHCSFHFPCHKRRRY